MTNKKLKEIHIKRLENFDPENFVNRSALESDFKQLISEDCVLIEDGKIRLIYKKLGFDDSELVDALKRIKYNTTERTGGLKTTSRIFGFAPRVPMRNDYCRSTSLADEFPREHAVVCNYARKVEDLYKSHDEKTYEQHKATTDEKIKSQYKIGGGVFTSGIINKNNPLKYHYDSGNFTKVFSCMLAIRYNCEGGYLALPEYGIGLAIETNSVTIFDGQSILHGVTPIKYVSPDAYRFTIVYYSLKNIWQCLPLDQELARIRSLKMRREMKRAGISQETLGDNVR